jgi:hypothetical protein
MGITSVKKDLQDLAQQLLIFGTHVHVAIEDREFLIDAMNVARTSSPRAVPEHVVAVLGGARGVEVIPEHHLSPFPADRIRRGSSRGAS